MTFCKSLSNLKQVSETVQCENLFSEQNMGHLGGDHIVVRFTFIYTIGTYPPESCVRGPSWS